MASIRVTNPDGKSSTLEITPGDTLMELLRDSGFDEIAAICGGSCSCATCHVHIEHTHQALPEVELDELVLLELTDEYDEEKSRLSCQIELDNSMDGMKVSILSPE